MQTQGKELGALDFYNIIGGPLCAVINAQAQAALTTANFIQKVGFMEQAPASPHSPLAGPTSTQVLKTVEFDYGQTLGETSIYKDYAKITVPLLSIVPIPYIRVDTMTIDLNITLHSTDTQKTTNDLTAQTDVSTNEGVPWLENVTIKASVTERNTYQRDTTTDDTYSMHVMVHAVQDQMPAGLGQVLNMFSSLVSQQAQIAQMVMTAEMQEKARLVQAEQKAQLESPLSP